MIRPGNPVSPPLPVRLRPLLVRGAGLSVQFLLLLLLSRARAVGGLAPFAPACFSAGLRQGMNPLAMLTGCALGSFMGGTSETDLLPLMSCAAVCLMYGAERLAAKRYGDRDELHDFLTGAYAGLSAS